MNNNKDYYQWLKSQPIDDLKLENVAEMWAYEISGKIPQKGTKEFEEMYERWVNYAFAEFK